MRKVPAMSDDELLTAFESCSLPFTNWSHRAHVRVAFLYASRFGLHEAIERMRSGIKAYNSVHDVKDGPEMGYHETTTHAFMRLVQRAFQDRGPFQGSHEFCEASPELLDRRVLLCYYTRDRILEQDAKDGFVEPDISPLDRIGLAFPEFGRRFEGVTYTLRPGGYGVIADEAGRIAVVVTPEGIHLPGGGQESGESAVLALLREAEEECGLLLRVEAPLGVADEFVVAQQEQQHFCKRCSFYSAVAVGTVRSTEPDHQLLWCEPDKAIERLSHGSQRWAVSRFVSSQR
jgi:8-oxo-dGTP pyrophosphatase MutT (NUDIX family)